MKSYENTKSTEHNYLKKLQKMLQEGIEFSPGYHDVIITHDDTCGIYDPENGICNCDPNIIICAKDDSEKAK